jgi:two-component system chemotaxis response regulator CheY
MPQPPKTIYVIDDDTALRTAYAAALSAMGYSVKMAADGVEGQALMAVAVPDLIILDMLMPNLDGQGFLEALHSNPDHQNIKVVIVSSFEMAPELGGLGVTRYLSKMQNPPEAVAAAVDQLLRQS